MSQALTEQEIKFYSALLAKLEKPIDFIITIDFESFWSVDFTLTKLQTEPYIRDPRFEVIGVGVKIGHGESVWTDEAGFRKWARTVDWTRVAVVCHHAHFDGLILSDHFGIIPGFYICTLSMARALHGLEMGNSLAKLAPRYEAGEKGHEVIQAKGKRLADFMPEEYEAYGRYCCNDCDLTRTILDRMLEGYLTGRKFPEMELWLIDMTVRCFTDPTFRVNETLLGEFLEWERDRKQDLLDRVTKDKSELLSNDKFAALLIELGEDPPMKVSEKKTAKLRERVPDCEPVMTYALAKTDPGMQELLEHERDEIRWVAEARVGVKSTINETRTERFLGMARRARERSSGVPVYIKYWGAHTGRWSGADKTNFQNLERTDEKKPEKGKLRQSLEAPDGWVLVVADSSQIEARKTAWLAGEEWLINAFRQGRDIYSEFASEAYGRKVDRKKNPDDFIPGFVGKTCVLGLGFQMGWLKFAGTMLKGANGGPPVQFTEAEIKATGANAEKFMAWEKNMTQVENMPSRLPLEERLVHCIAAKGFVNRYRARNSNIVEMWEAMNLVIAAMEEGVEAEFGPGGILQTGRHMMWTPSGMPLRYPGLRKSEDGSGYSYMGGKGGKQRVHIHGGKLTENIVQRLARDIVAEQALWIAAEGIKIVTTTHDEIVGCVPERDGEAALKFMLDVMKRPPQWAKDIPLAAEGGFSKSYGDAK